MTEEKKEEEEERASFRVVAFVFELCHSGILLTRQILLTRLAATE